MNQQHIEDNIYKILNKSEIQRIEIILGENYNPQLDKLSIIFKPEIDIDFTKVGEILNFINEYTMQDGYGDMTECDFHFTSFYHYDEGSDISCAFIFDINIDS